MSKFLSGRQSNLNLGISSSTENQTVLQTIGKVGIGTTTAQQHALYVVGSTNITDQIYIGGITVSGGSSIGADIDTRNLKVSGIATIGSLNVSTNFDVYDIQAVFHSDVRIDGNLSIGGTASTIIAQDLKILDREITLGITTNAFNDDVSSEYTANHGGISIASTQGSPLVDLSLVGLSSIPATYKQLMWVAANSFGVGTTDAWMFNYAVGIGSTLVPNNAYLAVGAIQATKDTLTTPNLNVNNILNVSGVSTFVGVGTFNSDLYVGQNLYANRLNITGGSSVGADVITRNLSVSGFSTLGISTASSLYVAGLSTFVGVGTFNNDLYVRQNLYANVLSITGGSSIGADVVTRNLSVSGVSTLGISTASSLYVAGLSTFVGVGTFRNDLYVEKNLYANALSITGGSSIGADVNTRNLNVSGISTFVGFATFRNNVSIAGSADINGNINFNGSLFQNNQPFIASRWTSGDGTNIYRLSNVGIGTTNPTQELDILGDIRVRGGIYDKNNSSGVVNNVLSSDGFGGWGWISVQQAGAGTINGISILDEGNTVGTANSVRSINFVGKNITAIGSGYASTVTFTDSPTFDTLGVTGLSTFFSNVGIGTTNPQFNLDVLGNVNFTGTLYQNSTPFVASRWSVGAGSSIYRISNVGIATTNPRYNLEVGPVGYSGTSLWVNGDANISGIVSASAYYGSGVNLTDLIQTINLTKLDGLSVKDEGLAVGAAATFVSLNFIGSNITATGIGSTANITVSDNPTFQSLNVTTGVTTVGFITASNISASGIVTALRYYGDGSYLTGVTAAGGQIYVQEEGVQVGAAVTTINIVGPRITAINGGVGVATISVDIDYFPIGDYGDLITVTTDAFGIPLAYSFDCSIQPPYSLVTVNLKVLT